MYEIKSGGVGLRKFILFKKYFRTFQNDASPEWLVDRSVSSIQTEIKHQYCPKAKTFFFLY